MKLIIALLILNIINCGPKKAEDVTPKIDAYANEAKLNVEPVSKE